MPHHVLATALLAVVPAVQAQLAYTSQSRYVEVDANTLTAFGSAPTFYPWFNSVWRQNSSNWGYAQQFSSLGFGVVIVHEEAGATGPLALARSALDVSFTVAQASDFRIDGVWNLGYGAATAYEATIALTSGGIDIFRWSRTSQTHPYAEGQLPVSGYGFLPPASYRLEAYSMMVGVPVNVNVSGSIKLDALLEVPTPGAAIILSAGLVCRRRPSRASRSRGSAVATPVGANP